ncbi:MAG: DUF3563 family protein [Rhizobacter sp.]|jgi:hypothetical protein
MDALEPLIFPAPGKPETQLGRVWRWLLSHERAPVPEEAAWLAEAADLAHLERRLRHLERDGLATHGQLLP